MFDVALAAQPRLARLCIVDTLATETAVADIITTASSGKGSGGVGDQGDDGGGGGRGGGGGGAVAAYRQSDHWRLADFDPSGPALAAVKELCLAGNVAWVDDAALSRVAALFPSLVALDVSGCPRVTDAGGGRRGQGVHAAGGAQRERLRGGDELLRAGVLPAGGAGAR